MLTDGEQARPLPTSPADAPGGSPPLARSLANSLACPALTAFGLSHAVCPPVQQEASEAPHADKTSQSAPSLEVTIQQRDHTRHFKMAGTQVAGAGLRCHMCDVTCHAMQMFAEHMSSSSHMSKWKDMTRAVSVITHTLTNRRRHWCDTCQRHFSDDVISHRRTKQHKARKRTSRPFCAACRRHLKTPRKFVEHMKSDTHKRQVLVKKAQEEELITVDAVGCFEEEEEEEEPKQEVEVSQEEAPACQVKQQQPRRMDAVPALIP
ncbi:uncharacterized protein LOC144018765 isoform X2 [Festucalex cinctus]